MVNCVKMYIMKSSCIGIRSILVTWNASLEPLLCMGSVSGYADPYALREVASRLLYCNIHLSSLLRFWGLS